MKWLFSGLKFVLVPDLQFAAVPVFCFVLFVFAVVNTLGLELTFYISSQGCHNKVPPAG